MAREHTAEIFNMAPFLEMEELPKDPSTGNPLIQAVLRRQKNDVWRVRTEPFRDGEPDGPLAWSLVRDGDLVRIPLLPYRTAQSPAHVLLGGMDTVQRYLEFVPNARRTHIVVGAPIEEVDGHFRFWIGFAAQTH